MKYRNINDGRIMGEEDYKAMIKREYEEYKKDEGEDAMSFEKYSELDGDFEVVVWDEEEQDYILYNDYISK